MLYQLKRAGISQNDLVKIYVSIIRPVLEYACPVWSTSLPKYLSYAIEMIQKRVLRSIHPGLHYDDILVLVGLQRPKDRCDNICKAYFNRLKSHRLNHLIPERRDVHYSLRNALEQYLLTVLVVLFYACIVLCIMYMTIQPTRLPIN